MIIFNIIDDITNDKEKEFLINLLDKYAELFNITYTKDNWNNIFG